MKWMENRSCVHFGIPPLDLKCYEGSFCFIFVVPSPKYAPAHSFVLSKYLLNECVTEYNKWCSSDCFTWAPDMFIMLSNLIICLGDLDFFTFGVRGLNEKWELSVIVSETNCQVPSFLFCLWIMLSYLIECWLHCAENSDSLCFSFFEVCSLLRSHLHSPKSRK